MIEGEAPLEGLVSTREVALPGGVTEMMEVLVVLEGGWRGLFACCSLQAYYPRLSSSTTIA